MTNDLATPSTGPLANTVDIDELCASDASYLNRFQLFGSKTDAVAEGKIPPGHYGIVEGDDIIGLGESVDVVVLSVRPKAMDLSNREDIITVFDIKSELFTEIKRKSGVKDSGCIYGPEFLLWLPDGKQFVTYFMSNKTSRKEAKILFPLVGRNATLKVRLASSARHKWHAPVVRQCTTHLNVPDKDAGNPQVHNFQYPESVETRTPVEPDESERAR